MLGGGAPAKVLTLLHFNDVYNIEPGTRDPCGGAARFAWKVKSMAKEKPMVIFSGDAYNPALMSTMTKGKQLVPILNALGVQASCVGNHDMDYGVENMVTLNKQCKFPWLMANVLDKKTGEPLGEAGKSVMIKWQGRKVGIVGLVEEEWIATLGTINPEDVTYLDFVTEGRRLARELKEQGAELLIALTHMRVPNDIKLAEEVEEFDIIAGGHDHHVEIRMVEPHNNLFCKSGTDFRNMTKIKVEFPDVPFPPGTAPAAARPKLSWEEVLITLDVPEDKAVAKIVAEYEGMLGAALGKEVGKTLTDLDGRFKTVRNAESNLGNLICDLWQEATGADCVILNSGSLRSDVIHPAGVLTRRDMMNVLPMVDQTMVIEVNGKQIHDALENGVSMYPKLEGRFPQVSGITFKFDPSKPAGARIVPGSVTVKGAPLDNGKQYTLATKEYLAIGKDGFDCLLGAKVIVDAECGVVLPTVVANHFFKLEVLNKFGAKQSTVQAAKNKFMKKANKAQDHGAGLMARADDGKFAIAPKLEGRIVNIAEP